MTTARPLVNESREIAAVIEVRVREQDVVDLRGIDGQRITIPRLEVSFLDEPAVDQHVAATGMKEEPRASHVAGGAEKLQGER